MLAKTMLAKTMLAMGITEFGGNDKLKALEKYAKETEETGVDGYDERLFV